LVMCGVAGADGVSAPAVISLGECVREALSGNPGVRAAAARAVSAREAVGQARSAWWPRLGVGASWAMTDNPPQAFMMALNQRSLDMMDPAFNPNEPDDSANMRFSAGLRYRCFDGGLRAAQAGMAEAGASAAGHAVSAARNGLIHEVTRGYYGVLQAQSFVGVMESSVSSLEESLRVARERLSAGAAVQTDVLNLEVQLAQAKEDLIRSRNGVRMAIAALNTAIGIELVPEAGIADAGDGAGEVCEVRGGQDGAEFMRAEVAAADAMVRVSENALARARRAYSPAVSLFGSYDWDTEEGDSFEGSYMAGLAAEWDVFTGFQRGHAVAQARADLDAARHEAVAARSSVALDVKRAGLMFDEAIERAEVARKSVENALEAARITRERYRQGVADISILLTAELGLTATRSRNVAARYDCLVARSNLARARGELVGIYSNAEGAKK